MPSLIQRLPDKLKASHVPAFLFYVLVAILVTLPVIFRLRTAVFGLGGDSLLQIWVIWWQKYSLLHGLDYRSLSLAQAPFATDHVKWFFRPIYTFTLALLAIPLREVAAYNLSIISGLTLAGFVAYRLAYAVTRNKLASLYAGAAYAIAPSALFFADDHGGLTQRWVFPLLLLAILNLRRKQSIGSALLLGAAAVLTADMHGYFGYFGVVLALTFVIVESVFLHRAGGWRAVFDRRRIGLYGLAVAASLVLYAPILIGGIRAYTDGPSNPLRLPQTFERHKDSFFWTSGRPWAYLLPAPEHVVLGGVSTTVIDTLKSVNRLDMAPPALQAIVPRLSLHWFWSTGTIARKILFLGWANLGLAGYLLYRRHRRKDLPSEFDESDPFPHRFWYVFFLTLFVVALLYTAPPYLPIGALLRPIWAPLHNIVIPMPSAITMAVAPQLRNPSYFIILVNLGLAMLAGMGLRLVIEQVQHDRLRWIVAGVLLVMMGFEVAVPSRSYELPRSEEYLWLAEQPSDTIVAYYPLNSRNEGYYQTLHERPTIGQPHAEPVDDGIFQIEQGILQPITNPDVAGLLAALGTEYVFYADEPLDETPDGLAVLSTSAERVVFEVTASPTPLVVLETYRDGLWMSEANFGWQGDRYTIHVWNPLLDDLVVDIELRSSDETRMDDLVVTRSLTPLPVRIFVAGVLQRNPMLRDEYEIVSLSDDALGGEWLFEGVTFQTGETILTFEWDDTRDPPVIDDILFTVQGREPIVVEP